MAYGRTSHNLGIGFKTVYFSKGDHKGCVFETPIARDDDNGQGSCGGSLENMCEKHIQELQAQVQAHSHNDV